MGGIREVRVGDCVHTHASYVISNPLGFWVGTGGWGQWGGVGVRGIRGVRVGDCVHTHSSYVISNPLGFWVGTGGWGGSGIVFRRILLTESFRFLGGAGAWGGGTMGGERRKLLPRGRIPRKCPGLQYHRRQ